MKVRSLSTTPRPHLNVFEACQDMLQQQRNAASIYLYSAEGDHDGASNHHDAISLRHDAARPALNNISVRHDVPELHLDTAKDHHNHVGVHHHVIQSRLDISSCRHDDISIGHDHIGRALLMAISPVHSMDQRI